GRYTTSSPPLTRRKHLRERGEAFLCDRPVEDFFSSDSDSGYDDSEYSLPYSEFKDWEVVRCLPGNSYIHVYHREDRRRKYFTYLKELLPHAYSRDIQALRRKMNRHFRLNPDADDGLDLWRDVNMLCRSFHGDDVEEFWRDQDDWIMSSWTLYTKSTVHVLDLTNGKTPAITEPSAKRQRVEEPSSQPATVSATSVSATVVSAAPDTSSLGASTFSVESQAKPVSAAPKFTDSTVITTTTMDSAVTRCKVGVSLFVDSAADASPFLSSIAGGPTPSNVFDVSAAPTVSAPRFFVADQIPVGVLFESTSMNLQEFFLDSDEEMPPGVSRVAAEPDSDDEVVAEILFRGQSICGDRVLFVDTLSDDEIADPRVKVETVSESTSSLPLTRRKHLGERGKAFLCDRPVEDFFSSNSDSDDDDSEYSLPYSMFKD
nr:hypothetical protein [Tanacetum cinerariifolium]